MRAADISIASESKSPYGDTGRGSLATESVSHLGEVEIKQHKVAKEVPESSPMLKQCFSVASTQILCSEIGTPR